MEWDLAMSRNSNKMSDGQSGDYVSEARRQREQREESYREQALKMYPWVCGRCGREFNRTNLRELTVHHRDHNHDNNPPDGSNWELLCVYCHDNEHARYTDSRAGGGSGDPGQRTVSTYRPFADLNEIIRKKDD